MILFQLFLRDIFEVSLYLVKKREMKESAKANIRRVNTADVPVIVALSDQKRRAYEKAQPLFWRRSEYANGRQAEWFIHLLTKDDHILFLAEDTLVVGFIIGRLMHAPEVYSTGGLTLMIDDFCVEESDRWSDVGEALLNKLKQEAREKGAVQVIVACGDHDEAKIDFLESVGLSVATRWYVGGIR